MLLLFCSECCDERPFDQPHCSDGHGFDCPEWFCAECGCAVLLATYPTFDLPAAPPAETPVRHAA